MRRRKLLISIGALGAGGTAAFGTEAFTSVEAERSVDVEIAGDSSAFLAIEPLSGNNANQYVSTEDDDTVALDFDGDDETSGSGVNQDAVTQVEDLFKIINQGTQPTSVFFKDDSDAVTFRVTRSTDTSTEGPNGESLEGEDNSVELETGEQVAVGITVDTLNNDVSGSLVDKVTIRADAGASAPDQSIPEPEYVVDGTGDEDKAFSSVADALDTNTGEVIESGAVLGIEGTINEDLSGQDINRDSEYEGNGNLVDIDTSNLTVVGVTSTNAGDSTPTLSLGSRQTLRANADGITLRNLDIEEPDSAGKTVNLTGDDVTANGLSVSKTDVDDGGDPSTGGPHIFSGGADVTITNCDLQGSPISLKGSGSATVTDNSISDTDDEGIFSFGTDGLSSVELIGNSVDNHNNDKSNNDTPSEIKIDESGVEVNGISSSNPDEQRVSLLQENDVDAVLVEDGNSFGTKISAQSNPFFGSTLQDAVDLAGSDGLTLVESGTFGEVSVSDASGPGFTGFTLQGTPTGTAEISGINASGVDGLTVEQVTLTGTSSSGRTINAPNASNLTVRDTIFEESSGAKYAVYAQGYGSTLPSSSGSSVDFTFENNDISDYPDTDGFASVYVAAAKQGDQLDTATVSGNSLTRNDGGIEVFGDGSSTVTMKDNSLISNTSAVGGLGVQDAGGSGGSVTIENNEIAQTDKANNDDPPRNGSGIAVQNSSNVTIGSNDLRNNVIGVFGRSSSLKSSNITSSNTLESNTTTTDIDNNP